MTELCGRLRGEHKKSTMDKRKENKTKDHKEKIRQSLLGRTRPVDVVLKISNSLKGRKTWNKGVAMPKEFGEKRSEINKRMGVIPPSRKGVKLSDEHKAKLKGRKPWNYKEDRTQVSGGLLRKDSKEYKEWAMNVKHRDNNVCVLNSDKCGGRIESHHIMNWIDYPELRFDINNGVSVCQKHHPIGRKKEHEMINIFQGINLKTWQAAW